jgi:hypothetical protein
MAKVSLCERIKALLSNFCVKIFSQNSLIPIQILNGFFIFYCATWESLSMAYSKNVFSFVHEVVRE